MMTTPLGIFDDRFSSDQTIFDKSVLGRGSSCLDDDIHPTGADSKILGQVAGLVPGNPLVIVRTSVCSEWDGHRGKRLGNADEAVWQLSGLGLRVGVVLIIFLNSLQ
uniref:Uncharacterized protein n=1 Tax=Hemiselmis tepida TaxID=464990 RepID=A0A7S0VJA6_9CRYP